MNQPKRQYLTTVQHFIPTFVSMKPLFFFFFFQEVGTFSHLFGIERSGGERGRVKLYDKAAKPLTSFSACVSIFINMKPLDVFDERPRHFNICKT